MIFPLATALPDVHPATPIQGMEQLNATLLLFCAVEAFFLLVSYRNFLLEIRASSIFFAMTVVAMATCLISGFSFIHHPHPHDGLWVLTSVLTHVGIYTIHYLYIRYLVVQVQEIHRVSSLVSLSVLVACVISAVLWALSIFDQDFASLELHSYSAGLLFWVANIGQFMLLLVSVILLIVNRKPLGGRHILVLMGLPLLIVLGTLFEPFLDGVRLVCPFIMIGLLIIYTQHHLDMANSYQLGRVENLRSRLNLAAGRMQPHYIYNVLTTIYYLCDVDVSKAQTALATFSDYLRNTLEAMDKDELVSFSWELSQVRNYVNLEKLRFGDRIRMIYDIEIEDFMIPPLTVQPLVENAVKHGLASKDEGGNIHLITRRQIDGGIQIRVVDDGIGFDVDSMKKNDETHEGVANARERIRLQCDGDLVATSAPGKGTSVMIMIHPGKAPS